MHADGRATVVVVSYNHAEYLPDALSSIAAQDLPGLEVIVVDDASSDASVEVIERELSAHQLAATTIFHTRNVGLCASLNEALARVRTPLVAYLSGDDWMEPGRFSRQVTALQAAPNAALVYGDVWIADSPRSAPTGRFSELVKDSWHAEQHGDLLRALLRTNWIPAPSVMARTDCLRQVGGFDESLPIEDYDMWLRLAAAGYSFELLEEPLVTWRRAGESLTDVLNRRSDIDKDLLDLQIWRKHLGADREIDAWLAPRLAHIAVVNLKRGSRSPVITETLRGCLKARPEPATLLYYAKARLRQARGSDVASR